jgi:hypothetical protein
VRGQGGDGGGSTSVVATTTTTTMTSGRRWVVITWKGYFTPFYDITN